MEKEKALQALSRELMEAKLPLLESNLVFGEGNINCQVLFIGEAPGQTENQLKRPFVGRAGKLLDELIKSVGWKRADVYITNIVKRRPPEHRAPLPEEIEAYKPYLSRQIEIINPKIIATLGRFSMNYFLPFAKITRDQGKTFEVNGRVIFPLFHPAAGLRNPNMLKELKESFKKLPDVVIEATNLKANAKKEAADAAEPIQRANRPQDSLF